MPPKGAKKTPPTPITPTTSSGLRSRNSKPKVNNKITTAIPFKLPADDKKDISHGLLVIALSLGGLMMIIGLIYLYGPVSSSSSILSSTITVKPWKQEASHPIIERSKPVQVPPPAPIPPHSPIIIPSSPKKEEAIAAPPRVEELVGDYSLRNSQQHRVESSIGVENTLVGGEMEKVVVVDVEEEEEGEEKVPSVEERLKHSFRFTDLEEEEGVNHDDQAQEKIQSGIIAVKERMEEQEGRNNKPRTLKELQEAMEGFDADDLTRMLNGAYGRS